MKIKKSYTVAGKERTSERIWKCVDMWRYSGNKKKKNRAQKI